MHPSLLANHSSSHPLTSLLTLTMSSKTSATVTIDEIDFLKLCLQHFKGSMNKADFEFDNIAAEGGIKDAGAA